MAGAIVGRLLLRRGLELLRRFLLLGLANRGAVGGLLVGDLVRFSF